MHHRRALHSLLPTYIQHILPGHGETLHNSFPTKTQYTIPGNTSMLTFGLDLDGLRRSEAKQNDTMCE